MNTFKIGVVCTMLITVAMSALALDYATATGADILNEHASLRYGYNAWQRNNLKKKIQGRFLTFENGHVKDVIWSYIGEKKVLVVQIDFSRTLAPFIIWAIIDDPKMIEWAQYLNIDRVAIRVEEYQRNIKVLQGIVWDEEVDAIALNSVAIAVKEKPKRTFDFEGSAKDIGKNIINAARTRIHGFTTAQLDIIVKNLSGKKLTLENGMIETVSSSEEDGMMKVYVEFDNSLTVGAEINCNTNNFGARLHRGVKVKSFTGIVRTRSYSNIIFDNASIELAE